MSQNSERLSWTVDEVDGQLKKMMENIHRVSAEAAEEYGLGYNLVAGANIAGFKKVAEAMLEQGLFYFRTPSSSETKHNDKTWPLGQVLFLYPVFCKVSKKSAYPSEYAGFSYDSSFSCARPHTGHFPSAS